MTASMRRNWIGGGVAAVMLWAVSASAVDSGAPAGRLPSAAAFSSSLLQERKDVVSWQTLAKLEAVERRGRMMPVFSKEILALDNRVVKVQGFMIPLDVGEKQTHFLLAAVPSHCPFCLPAGPDALVEIQASSAVGYTFEPLVMTGRFAVLPNDPAGVFYRMTDATKIDASEVPARTSAPPH